MKGLLLTSAIVAVFVAVVITMRIMAPPPKPVPQLADAVPPSVERTLKTDKTEPDIRIIPPSPDGGMMAAHQSSDRPPEPTRPAPKIEEKAPEPPKVDPPKEDTAKDEPGPNFSGHLNNSTPRENNNGICARYGGYKVTTYRHGWQSWHCVYPHRR